VNHSFNFVYFLYFYFYLKQTVPFMQKPSTSGDLKMLIAAMQNKNLHSEWLIKPSGRQGNTLISKHFK